MVGKLFPRPNIHHHEPPVALIKAVYKAGEVRRSLGLAILFQRITHTLKVAKNTSMYLTPFRAKTLLDARGQASCNLLTS